MTHSNCRAIARSEFGGARVAVVIPCYRVKGQIMGVLDGIGPEVSAVYVVDDCCPEGSGRVVEEGNRDPRVKVVYHPANEGVGGATMTGYRQALGDGADVVVKLDGDGQMDPRLIPVLIRPLLGGYADYAKGNRFYDLEGLVLMPRLRLFGNAVLSFMSKLSSGYWKIFDPTNGFTAIAASVLRQIPMGKINKRYFFESDLLFRLNVAQAVVLDVPMPANYGEEQSSLKVGKVVHLFLYKHLENLFKRLFYNYVLRDFSPASIELFLGLVLFLFGFFFGAYSWIGSYRGGVPVTSGTVMLSALPVFIGFQLLLAFLTYDMSNEYNKPISDRLS